MRVFAIILRTKLLEVVASSETFLLNKYTIDNTLMPFLLPCLHALRLSLVRSGPQRKDSQKIFHIHKTGEYRKDGVHRKQAGNDGANSDREPNPTQIVMHTPGRTRRRSPRYPSCTSIRRPRPPLPNQWQPFPCGARCLLARDTPPPKSCRRGLRSRRNGRRPLPETMSTTLWL